MEPRWSRDDAEMRPRRGRAAAPPPNNAAAAAPTATGILLLHASSGRSGRYESKSEYAPRLSEIKVRGARGMAMLKFTML